MRSFSRIRIAALIAVLPALGRADLITNVSSSASVTVATGASIDVSFGTWTYAANNPGYSPAPLNIQFQAYAAAPSSAVLNVPGTNQQYYSGYLSTGYVESTDGSVIATLDDPYADKLGLAKGSIVAGPALYAGDSGSQHFAALSASLALSQSAAAQLFGAAATQAWTSDAVLVLTNRGAPMTFEASNGAVARSAFVEPSLTGSGPVQTSGVTLSVQLDQPGFALRSPSISSVPEPASAELMAAAGFLAGFAMLSYRSRKSRTASSSPRRDMPGSASSASLE